MRFDELRIGDTFTYEDLKLKKVAEDKAEVLEHSYTGFAEGQDLPMEAGTEVMPVYDRFVRTFF